MRIVKKPMRGVSAASAKATRSRVACVKAAEDMEDIEEPIVDVAPEVTDILFETEDVAELLAEVTDSEVVAEIDEDSDAIVFTVDGDEYIVEPDGDEEILEAVRRPFNDKKSVKASRRIAGAKRAVRH